MKTKVFAIANIELVRVDNSNRAEMNLHEVLFWFQQKNRATSCHSGKIKVIFYEGLKDLVNRKWILSKCLPKLTSKIG